MTVVEALFDSLPSKLAPRLHELFEGIHFLESSVVSAHVEAVEAGRYALVVECAARGVQADGDGDEAFYDVSDLLELDVVLAGQADPARLEATVEAGRLEFRGTFDRLPTAVVLDPRLLSIDRDLSDNRRSVVEVSR